MWAQDHRTVSHPISRITNDLDDGLPSFSVTRAFEVGDVLEHQEAGSLRAHDGHDVEKQRAARLVEYSVLGSRLRERLTWKPGAEHLVIGNHRRDHV